MAVKSTFPNVKQPITDSSGYVTKAHFDFLRTLWLRTGGNNDNISDIEMELSAADLFIFRNRINEIGKRIIELEKEVSAKTSDGRIRELEKKVSNLEKELSSYG